MDWGNVIITDIIKDNSQVLQLAAKLNLEGDFRKTEKKLTWLSPDPQPLQPVTLLDYDFLISKKKLEEDDKLQDFLTPVTEFITNALGDANLATLKKGDMIQLERKGFYITDCVNPLKLILIPDGKAKSTSSKSPLPKAD